MSSPSSCLARIVSIVVAAFVAALGCQAPATSVSQSTEASTAAYTYVSPHIPIARAYIYNYREPPSGAADLHHRRADDLVSFGALARSVVLSEVRTYDYDDRPRFALSDGTTTYATSRSQEATGGATWVLAPPSATGVAANAADNVADACRANSFTGGTLVLMADGTKKPINDVKLGDRVMATDPETGMSGPRKVIDLIRHGGWHTMVAIRLADGTSIDATDRHPFWVESRKAWVDASDLQPGDVVVDADGDQITVAGVGISEQDLTAYNLTVAGLHTYFAGEGAVLVHNTGCTNIADLPASAVRNLTEDSGYAFSRLSQNHGVTRIEFREQIHIIKRNENLPADFNVSFGPTGDVWNPRTGELIGGIAHGG